jgi:hypothetical protein
MVTIITSFNSMYLRLYTNSSYARDNSLFRFIMMYIVYIINQIH